MWEIEEKFTKSELGIVSWRSQETYHQMSKKIKDVQPYAPDRPNVPDKFLNEKGELDLRNVTGPEAWRYLSSIGKVLPIIPVEGRD